MRRREFIAGLGGAAAWPFARPLAAEAQRRVGALINGTDNDPRYRAMLGGFREGLATFGWVEGRNLRIDYRFAGGDPNLAAHALELVNFQPDVIFAHTGPAARAVQQRTSVIPIVFMGGADPTSIGLLRNVARPDANVTGFADSYGSLGGRWLELFKEAIPVLTRVADVFPANAFDNGGEFRATIPAAAAQLGVMIIRMPVRSVVEVEHAISAFVAEPEGGLLLTGVNSSNIFEAIGRLALYHRLPLMYDGSTSPAQGEGVLMAWRGALPPMLTASSAAQNRVSCLSNIRLSSSWSSISRPQKQSG